MRAEAAGTGGADGQEETAPGGAPARARAVPDAEARAEAAIAAAETRFGAAWRRALGSRRHADMPLRPRRPPPPACGHAPRVIALPLHHSPAPCALAALQGGAAEEEREKPQCTR